jgi:hypothetical protein
MISRGFWVLTTICRMGMSDWMLPTCARDRGRRRAGLGKGEGKCVPW